MLLPPGDGARHFQGAAPDVSTPPGSALVLWTSCGRYELSSCASCELLSRASDEPVVLNPRIMDAAITPKISELIDSPTRSSINVNPSSFARPRENISSRLPLHEGEG